MLRQSSDAIIPGPGGDELRGALGAERSTGKREPARLTAKQLRIVGALVEAYGEDVEAMARDRKLNAMQHSVGVLKKLVEGYVHSSELAEKGGARDFRAPVKSLKGLLHKGHLKKKRK